MAKKQSRKTQVIPAGETKSERFTRVVCSRVGKAVKAIEVVGFCAGPTYEYTPKQVEQISEALYAAMAKLTDVFAGKATTQGSFKFKS